ncbi:alpha/beta hydrolase [Novosphingobium piscinae]|uniref:Alpha/beta hydrolase n=1 Tax=Novosphingobium piscinae TaxID=1507448 RepID=A0A7X1KQ39_9SPHN|nr:alpha/beta hydrolase [Novosphingobium piscinae]
MGFAGPVAAQPVLVAEPVLAAGAVRETLRDGPARVGGDDAAAGSGRFVASPPAAPALPRGIAAFGPFRVLDGTRAALVGVTDERSPAAFQAMLARHPGIRVLELIECPGTEEDRANLRLGRMIRARGLATHVPAGGSVRSGAVELYLAGVRRSADPGAEFAVHAWADEDGREPRDFPADAPQNRAYLDYYRAMGLSAAEARAFYAMTNSVPNAGALWLDAAQMARWVRPE